MVFRNLTADDLDGLMELQEYVIERLPDKNCLRYNSREMFENVITSGACCMGAFDREQMVAVGLSHLCQNTEEDLSLHLERFSCVNPVNMKSVIVHPDYRGQKLQLRLMTMMEEELTKMGFDALLCTVDPENSYSANNVIKMGYSLDHQEVKYGGLTRNVYIKKI